MSASWMTTACFQRLKEKDLFPARSSTPGDLDQPNPLNVLRKLDAVHEARHIGK